MQMVLTIDKDLSGSLMFLILTQGPIRDSTPIGTAIILFGRNDRQNRLRGLVLIPAHQQASRQRLWRLTVGLVPQNFGRRRSTNWGASKVQRPSFSGGWVWRGNGRWRRLKQDRQLYGFWVQNVSSASFLHATFKLSVVPVVIGLLDVKVVFTLFGFVFHPGK